MIFREPQDIAYGIIPERADNDSIQVQRDGLQKQVFRRMTGFDMYVLNTPLAILATGALEDCCKDHDRGGLPHP